MMCAELNDIAGCRSWWEWERGTPEDDTALFAGRGFALIAPGLLEQALQ